MSEILKTTEELKLIDIDELIPYANNARTHSKDQINKLRSSLREFGFINPILIDKDYNILAGHGRVMAAREEGIKEVPCVLVEHLTEAQKKAYILADNRLAMDAGWDDDFDVDAAYIFHADTEGLNFRKAFKDAGFHIANVCIWAKQSLVLGRSDYQWQHEPILYGWKPTGKHRWYSDRKQTTIWNFDRPTKSELHPTMKPVPLVAYPIQNSSMSNCIILEPFAGSGSTLIACEQIGRICYAIELDEKYADVIVKRYIEYVGTDEEVFLIRDGEKIPYKGLMKSTRN